MAVTGLAWFLFLIGHLYGNLFIFSGAKAFNGYAAKLESLGGVLIAAEVGLIIFLVTHIYSGLKVSFENRSARSQSYAVKTTRGQATAFSRSMLVGGVILAVFIVTHVIAFKFGDHHSEGGLYGLVTRAFKGRLTVAWYILAMFALGMHLSHGLGSALHTLGVSTSVWRDRLRMSGVAIGWIIASGFMILPVWAFFYA